ncbi:MAG: hypothetical protein RR290_03960 [Clostridia bacterium]
MTNQQWIITSFIFLAVLGVIIGIAVATTMAKSKRKSSSDDYDEPVEKEDNKFVTFLQDARITTSDGINRIFHFQKNGFVYLQEEGKKAIEFFSFSDISKANWENEQFKFILEKYSTGNFIFIKNDINNNPISVQLISPKGKKIL